MSRNNVSHTLLSFSNFFRYQEKETEQQYQNWKRDTIFVHIAVISFITAILYILYTAVSMSVIPHEAKALMIYLHMLGVALPLFLISLFAHYQKHYRVIVMAMMIAPVIATVSHYILLMQVGWQSIYFPEVYLIIIWTFAISGLSLFQATVSALFILLIAIGNIGIMSHLSEDILVMHLFWLLISFILGFLGAFLLERHHKVNFIQHQVLEKLATTDTLTGVHNRTQFREFLQNEIDKARESSYVFGLMMIDIDFFKEVNDTHGHQIGDEVLKGMAQLLKHNIRATDTIIRWGGEEFMVICRETYKGALTSFSHKIREMIENHQFIDVGNRTISIGITCFKKGDTIDALLNRVDMALHQAKENGRNTVVYHAV